MSDVLNTIQTKEKLNDVMRVDEVGPGGAYHHYAIFANGSNAGNMDALDVDTALVDIKFQKGPRHDVDATHGVIDSDLLEIVRDRLTCFQSGQFANDYNAQALYHVEEALKALNARVEDRIARNVLGTNNQ